MEQLTRKGFLAAASAVAGLGIVAAAQNARADEGATTLDTAVPDAWDLEADIVVLGAGIAGIRAACEAYDQGQACILVEKQPPESAGGDSRCNFGGIFISVHTFDQNELNTLGNRDEEFCRYVDEQGEELVSWLEEGGNTWLQDTSGSSTRELAAYSTTGKGPELYQSCLNNLAKTDVEVLYETKATRLVKNPSTGEILGVRVEGASGPRAIRAKKAVVIATGGYACDDKLMQAYHVPGVHFYPLGGPFNTGDGLKFGADAGVALSDLARSVEYAAPVCKAASDSVDGQGVFMCWPENFVSGARMWVNALGKRFMNEDTVLTHWKGDTIPVLSFDYVPASAAADIDAGYANLPMYLIVDQACFDAQSLGNQAASWSWTRLVDYNNFTWSEDNQAELEAGYIVQGETLEELAEKLGIDPEGLVAQVASFNDGAQTGSDEFGRDASSVEAFGSGPYYGIELAPSVIYTIGGLKANSKTEAVDNFGNVIPRLYIAGNVGLGSIYPLGLDGAAAEGRLAAANASALEPWS
jgi:succinate dehydrogenase/fumarate reductase flavoprotein subunit